MKLDKFDLAILKALQQNARVALLLVIPPAAPAGFVLAALLSAAFVTMISIVVVRGLDVGCRCFGRAESALRGRHVVRGAVLLATAALGLLSGGGTAVPLGGTLVAVSAGLVLGVRVISMDDLVDLATGDLAGTKEGVR